MRLLALLLLLHLPPRAFTCICQLMQLLSGSGGGGHSGQGCGCSCFPTSMPSYASISGCGAVAYGGGGSGYGSVPAGYQGPPSFSAYPTSFPAPQQGGDGAYLSAPPLQSIIAPPPQPLAPPSQYAPPPPLAARPSDYVSSDFPSPIRQLNINHGTDNLIPTAPSNLFNGQQQVNAQTDFPDFGPVPTVHSAENGMQQGTGGSQPMVQNYQLPSNRVETQHIPAHMVNQAEEMQQGSYQETQETGREEQDYSAEESEEEEAETPSLLIPEGDLVTEANYQNTPIPSIAQAPLAPIPPSTYTEEQSEELSMEDEYEPLSPPVAGPSAPNAYSNPAPAPAPSYSNPAPAPSYNNPAPAPAPSYSNPAPAPSYNNPAPAPAPSHSNPAPAPSYNNPAPAPAPSYSNPAPAPSYNNPAPAPSYSIPSTPAPNYNFQADQTPSYRTETEADFGASNVQDISAVTEGPYAPPISQTSPPYSQSAPSAPAPDSGYRVHRDSPTSQPAPPKPISKNRETGTTIYDEVSGHGFTSTELSDSEPMDRSTVDSLKGTASEFEGRSIRRHTQSRHYRMPKPKTDYSTSYSKKAKWKGKKLRRFIW